MQRGSRSIATTSLGAEREQGARQPARPGPDLDHRHAVERTGGARDAGGEVEIEQEILAERLARREVVAADHLAQRRQVVERGHQPTAARIAAGAVSRDASFSAATRLVGSARPLPAMSKAVP